MWFDAALSFIIGGVLATAPAGVVRLEITDGQTVGHCTATVTRDKAIHTAAHCANSKGKPEILLGFARFAVLWSHVDKERDYALGYVAHPELIDSSKFMEADFAFVPKTGDELRIGGFGCFNKHQEIDFRYREGTAKVSSLTTTGFELKGPAIVCMGDSGGPAMRGSKLVGVISAVEPWSHSFISTP